MSAADVKTETVDPLTAVWLGTKETWSIIDRTFSFIGGLFAGTECADQVGGVVKIAQISGQVASLGFMPVLQLAAMLSVSIGLLNLFPVPLLDGGHLLFYAIEAVRGRPLPERAQEIGFRIGFAIVVMLMIFTFINDTSPWWSRLVAS
jgi:regulator of sigma E protease